MPVVGGALPIDIDCLATSFSVEINCFGPLRDDVDPSGPSMRTGFDG